jgi:Raf kinase inhibitor-like YbhB/YbcL family protein
MKIELTSSVFRNGRIPSHYTCDGDDVSPPLAWNNIPPGTKSLALIADDPDAPNKTWVHWVIFNIPPFVDGLPEDVRHDGLLPNGACQGRNDFGRIGYGGPCPPSGTHRYFFKLFALDTLLDLEPGSSKDEVLEAMQGHILGQSELMGEYRRD